MTDDVEHRDGAPTADNPAPIPGPGPGDAVGLMKDVPGTSAVRNTVIIDGVENVQQGDDAGLLAMTPPLDAPEPAPADPYADAPTHAPDTVVTSGGVSGGNAPPVPHFVVPHDFVELLDHVKAWTRRELALLHGGAGHVERVEKNP